MSEVRKSFYILIPLLSCVIAVLLLEVGLALFYPIPFSLEKNMYFETDPYTGFRHKPLGSGHYPNGIQALANSRGQRDDEVEIPKPADVFRVLLIGDSFTVGANVEQDEAYPQVLERILDAGTDRTVEVVNTGTGGWGPFQYAQFYEHYGAQFEPDLIVVGFFVGNDTYIDRSHINDTRSAVMGRRLPRDRGQHWRVRATILLYENSHIARALISPGAPSGMTFLREECDQFPDYHLGVQANRLDNHLANPDPEARALLDSNILELARMQQQAEAAGIPLLVVIFPDENQINPDLQSALLETLDSADYDFEMPQKLLRNELTAAGIEYLDLLELIRADARCLFMNDTHWIPAGHVLVAEQISLYLHENQRLPAN